MEQPLKFVSREGGVNIRRVGDGREVFVASLKPLLPSGLYFFQVPPLCADTEFSVEELRQIVNKLDELNAMP